MEWKKTRMTNSKSKLFIVISLIIAFLVDLITYQRGKILLQLGIFITGQRPENKTDYKLGR